MKMRDVQDDLCNMVLFHCRVCSERFVTFHPDKKPFVSLDVLRHYPHEVHEWETLPADCRAMYATLRHGKCLRCHKELIAVELEALLKGYVKFGTLNSMDALFGIDDVRVCQELHHVSVNATVVESKGERCRYVAEEEQIFYGMARGCGILITNVS